MRGSGADAAVPPLRVARAGSQARAAAGATQHQHPSQQPPPQDPAKLRRDAARRASDGATPLLFLILWLSAGCSFTQGYAQGLATWLLGIPGATQLAFEDDTGACTCGCGPKRSLPEQAALGGHPSAASGGTSGAGRGTAVGLTIDDACGRELVTPSTVVLQNASLRAFPWLPSAGMVVASVVGAWLITTRGRRPTLLLAELLLLVGFLTAALAQDYGAIVAGNILTGAGSGLALVANTLVDSEVAPARARLGLVTLSNIAAWGVGETSAGALSFAGLAFDDTGGGQWEHWFFRLVAGFGAWPCLLLLVLIPLVPESPFLLAARGRVDEGLHALQELRGPFADVSGEYADALEAVAAGAVAAHERGGGGAGGGARARRRDGGGSGDGSAGGCLRCGGRGGGGFAWCGGCCGKSGWLPAFLRSLLSPQQRPAMAVCLLLGVVTGVESAAVPLMHTFELQLRGSVARTEWWAAMSVAAHSMTAIAGLIAPACGMDRASRRALLVGGSAAIVVLLAVMAVVAERAHADAALDAARQPVGVLAITFVASGLIKGIHAGTKKPLAMVLPVELSLPAHRAANVAVMIFGYHLARIAVPFALTSPGLQAVSAAPCVVAAGALVLVTALAWAFVPDGTQGLPLRECRRVWRKHWYWGRRVQHHNAPGLATVSRGGGGGSGTGASGGSGVAGGGDSAQAVETDEVLWRRFRYTPGVAQGPLTRSIY